MFKTISQNEKEVWDSIVKSFINYDVNYLCDYVSAFKEIEDEEPILFYYESNNTRAIYVFIKRDISNSIYFKGKIPEKTFFDIISPYGYGGFLIEGSDPKSVYDSFTEYCTKNDFVSEFVRFHLLSNSKDYFPGLLESNMHNIIRTLDLPLDEIVADFEYSVRKNINKAMRSGLIIEVDTDGNRINDFLEIYYETMTRTGANASFFFPKKFFEDLNSMVGQFVYIHVLFEEKVIASELVLYGAENCYSFLGGTNKDYFKYRPNDFLKFGIIKWAQSIGLKRFILGGGYGREDGIYNYKKAFSPNGEIDFFVGKRILDCEKYDQLVLLREHIGQHKLDKEFFPEYRANSKE